MRKLEAAEVADRTTHEPAPGSSRRDAAAAAPPARGNRPKKRKVNAFWLKQLHTWHWVSAAVSLAGMLLFAITGLTLNHAAAISAKPVVVDTQGHLPASMLDQLRAVNDSTAPLPADVAKAVAAAVPVNPAGYPADWSSDDEVYVAMPGPGRDAWVAIDRASGDITAEVTDRGWISYLNDLHKGRNTGSVWFWFIDLFAVACVVFTITGLLLLQLHARHRPSTWPLVGLSLLIPVLIALFFIH